MLGRAEGTPYAGYARQLAGDLTRWAAEYAASLAPPKQLSDLQIFLLGRIYENFITTIVRILERFTVPEEIVAAAGLFSRCHLAGLRELFNS